MLKYAKADGPRIKDVGEEMVKKPNPVYMVKVSEEFEVETNEGVLHGKPGDHVAYDPISGHVWPVSAEYVVMHYDRKED